jgi:RNA polymerase sigma-70 factor (ECF subfamily)
MKAAAPTTEALVAQCVAGEPHAWRELHRRYYAMVHGFLHRLGVRAPDAEDACQEVFVQVFRYLATFEHRADLRTWLYKLCLSQAARLRRRAALGRALGWLWRQDADGVAPSPQWSEPEALRRVHAALDRMKAIHRDVFVLFELEGLSGDEVASVTGLPHATVRRRLHDARHEFETLMRDEVPR